MADIEGAKIIPLNNAFEVKQFWLYSEWGHEIYAHIIQPVFPNQEELIRPKVRNEQYIQHINETFDKVRGNYALWGEQKENGKWVKITVELPLEWIRKNVQVLYPSNDKFDVNSLEGIVLWHEPPNHKYLLLEGNHRISVWLDSGVPITLRAVLFIGESN